MNKEAEYTDFISKDNDGNVFISFEQIREETLIEECRPLTHCLAVVKVNGDYLLGWNKWRKRYEIFGGCIEKGETPRECIIRECFEELGCTEKDFAYLGVMKLLLAPDYFSPVERIEYGALYGITLPDDSLNAIYKRVKDKDEIRKLALYGEIKGKEPTADIDIRLFDYYT